MAPHAAASLPSTGRDPAGADPTRVPAVPQTVAAVTCGDQPHLTLTHQVEYGDSPLWQMRVRPDWAPGPPPPAVIGGRVVLDVLDWRTDPATGVQRPEQVLTAGIDGHFDPRMHGRRAWAFPATRTADRSDLTRPRLMPAH